MCPFLRSFVKIFRTCRCGEVAVKSKTALLMWAVAGSLLASCAGWKREMLTPAASGRPYELLVVADAAGWRGEAGAALRRALETDVPGLPQAEPSFRLMHASPKAFDAVLRLVRNILVVEVDRDRHSQVTFRWEKDVYASPQVIFTLGAPDEAAVAAWTEEYGPSLVRFFTQVERERRVQELKENHSAEVLGLVREMFGCEVWVPSALKASKTGRDFLWVGTNAATDDRNFVMYSYPYTTEAAFTKAGFIHKRDSVMKVNIPGACPGMYMATDTLMSDDSLLRVQGTRVLEVRGLWRMEGDFMGGPYVAHARLDTVRRRVVVAEVFIYAPNRPKRNLLRGLEASLYTLRCLDEMK